MKTYTALEVLAILAERLEDRAKVLERVHLDGYTVTIAELRRFSTMVWSARDYLQRLGDGGEGERRAGIRMIKQDAPGRGGRGGWGGE